MAGYEEGGTHYRAGRLSGLKGYLRMFSFSFLHTDCGTPPTPANGHVEFPGGTLVGAAAIFTCDQGYYQTAGIAFRICQADGTWDGTDVVCSPVGM